MTQAEQQIVAQGAGEKVRRRADITDPAADDRDWKGREVGPADRNPAARRLNLTREQQGKFVLAAAALPDDRDVLIDRNRKADGVEHAAAVVLGERQVGNGKLAGERRHPLGLVEQQANIHHVRRLELLDDLLVLDLGVLKRLIENQQLVPR